MNAPPLHACVRLIACVFQTDCTSSTMTSAADRLKSWVCLSFAAVTPGIRRFNLADHAVPASSKGIGSATFIFAIHGYSWLAYIKAIAEGKIPLH